MSDPYAQPLRLIRDAYIEVSRELAELPDTSADPRVEVVRDGLRHVLQLLETLPIFEPDTDLLALTDVELVQLNADEDRWSMDGGA